MILSQNGEQIFFEGEDRIFYQPSNFLTIAFHNESRHPYYVSACLFTPGTFFIHI